MKDAIINKQGRYCGYHRNGTTFLERCPDEKCGRENYAFSIMRGTCAWCGYDANKKEVAHE